MICDEFFLNFRLFIICIFLFTTLKSFSQQEKIKIRKQNDQLIFFQKGIQSDTILKNKNDLFCLVIPDTLVNLTISIENGNFQKTKNDSIVKLIYIPGIKYECVYREIQKEQERGSTKKLKERNCLINGIPEQASGIIKITFYIKGHSEPLLVNKFIFR